MLAALIAGLGSGLLFLVGIRVGRNRERWLQARSKTGMGRLLDELEQIPVSSVGLIRRGDTDPVTHSNVSTAVTVVSFLNDSVQLRVAETMDDKSWVPDIIVDGAMVPRGLEDEVWRIVEVARVKLSERVEQRRLDQLLLGDGSGRMVA